MLELLAATGNRGKIKELKEFLADLPVCLKSLEDFEEIPEVLETGATFAENAALKAREYARHTKTWALADDSGLEVDALGGAPGVFSARYAGASSSDRQKIEKLLRELERTDSLNRAARFVCAMAVADDKGEIRFIAEGVCDGKISNQPLGTNGFGYDPIFIPDGFEMTFGQLSDRIKREISHRALASAKIIRFFRDFTAL